MNWKLENAASPQDNRSMESEFGPESEFGRTSESESPLYDTPEDYSQLRNDPVPISKPVYVAEPIEPRNYEQGLREKGQKIGSLIETLTSTQGGLRKLLIANCIGLTCAVIALLGLLFVVTMQYFYKNCKP